MGKFKIGDKVRVRKDLINSCYYGNYRFIPSMKNRCGEIVTIESVERDGSYRILEDVYNWTDEMFEEKVSGEDLYVSAFKINYIKTNITRIVRNKKTTVVFWEDGTKTIVKLGENQIDNQEMAILWAYFEKNSGLSKTKAHKVMEDLINNIYQQDKTKIKISSEKGTIKIRKSNGTITASKIVLPKLKDKKVQ